MSIPILELIDQQRKSRGMTRDDMARKMNEIDGGNWDKESVDKIFSNNRSLPRADTLCVMKLSVGMADFDPYMYRNEE